MLFFFFYSFRLDWEEKKSKSNPSVRLTRWRADRCVTEDVEVSASVQSRSPLQTKNTRMKRFY